MPAAQRNLCELYCQRKWPLPPSHFDVARERSLQANGQLLNINLIQNPAVKKLAERYLQCVNDFRQLHWQVCIHFCPRCGCEKSPFFPHSIPSIWR